MSNLIPPVVVVIAVLFTSSVGAEGIKDLSEHFNEPGADTSPWMFVPKSNIGEKSTREHPGLMTIWEAGKGQDVKGILAEPIPMEKYPFPWEFQVGFVQNFSAMLAHGAGDQSNYAIGLNVAITFSDPSEWPQDRTKRPPDTRDFQLLVVHLGATGEAGAGLPQFSDRPHPDRYLVWGRGDLGYATMGNWNIPSIWVGDGGRRGGPANDHIFFRFRMLGPTSYQFGFRGDQSYAFHMRRLDVSRYGTPTGIWEIGPIISGDSWISDVLCRNLPMEKGWHDVGDLKSDKDSQGRYRYGWEKFYHQPDPVPPKKKYPYHIDYCIFMPSAPLPLEEFSDDFNIPGYMAKWQAQPQSTLIETYSNPGNLTLTMIGSPCATGVAPVGGSELDLSMYKPPWEIEIAFTAPDDTIPWNWWMNWQIFDRDGKPSSFWHPGVQNFPGEDCHRYTNVFQPTFDSEVPAPIDVIFDPEIPESILSAKPLSMLIQVIDPSHVRVGFRANQQAPWYFSRVCDVEPSLGGPIGKFGQHAFGTKTGREFGAPPGSPMFQRFIIDYIDYRYGLSK